MLLYVAISVAITLLWIPVLLFFFKNWHHRDNPISLAICGIIFYINYCDWMTGWSLCLNETSLLYAMHVGEFCTVIFFYISLRWARAKFGGRLGAEKREL